MRTQLQLKIPLFLGVVLFVGHSLLVLSLYYTSLRNIEFGALWEHMRLADLPVSTLLDTFYEAYLKVFGETPQSTYHMPYFLFHLIFGGLQFFAWGWLVGALWKKLLQPRCPAQKV